MEKDDWIKIKFRLSDGTDIGPKKYHSSMTVRYLKQIIFSQWPRGNRNAPNTIYELKVINSGKILDNDKTLKESGIMAGEFLGSVLTMHLVVQPKVPLSEKSGKKGSQKECCRIL